MHERNEVGQQLDLTDYDSFSRAMTAVLNPPEMHKSHHPVAIGLLGVMGLSAGIGMLANSGPGSHNASPVAVTEGSVVNGKLLNVSSVNSESATFTVSAPESVTGPAGSGSCSFLTPAAAAERLKANPNAPAQTKSELLNFMSANPDRANKIDDAMEAHEGPLLSKIIPEGQTDALAYFKNMEVRRLDKGVNVVNTFCDAQGNVIKWRTETLAAGTDVFVFVVKDGVFTRADGTTVQLSQADMANSIVVNQNGETLLVELKDPCNNVLSKIFPKTVVTPTTKPRVETTTTAPATTTTTRPIVTTTTSTTTPASTTTSSTSTTSTTRPIVTTTTSTTTPASTTTSSTSTTSTTRPTTTSTTKGPVPCDENIAPCDTTTTRPITTTTRPVTTTTRPITTTTRPVTSTTKGPVPCDPNIAPCDTLRISSQKTAGTSNGEFLFGSGAALLAAGAVMRRLFGSKLKLNLDEGVK